MASILSKESKELFWVGAFQNYFENNFDGFIIIDQDALIRHANAKFCHMSGFTKEELTGISFCELDVYVTEPQLYKYLNDVQVDDMVRYDSVIKGKEEKNIKAHIGISKVDFMDTLLFLITVKSLSRSEGLYNTAKAGVALQELSVKASSRKHYFDSLLKLIKKWSGCKNIGIRTLRPDGTIPYEAYTGFSEAFWKIENWISCHENNCVCTRIVREISEKEEVPYKTLKGSFHTRNFSDFVKNIPESKLTKYRGTCNKWGYKSLAVIPIRYSNNVIGTLHLADEKPGKINNRLLQFLEKTTGYIGDSIYRYNIEEKLQKTIDILNATESLFRMSLQEVPLNEILDHALEKLSSISWSPFKLENHIYLTGKAKTSGFPEAELSELRKSVPILSSGKILGQIYVQLPEDYKENLADEELLKSLADKLAEIIIRKQAEKLLRVSERHLSLIHNSVKDFICLLKVEGKNQFSYVSVNKAYMESTNRNENSILKKNIDQILSKSSLELTLAKYQEAIETKTTIEFEEIIMLSKGHLLVQTSVTPIFDASGTCTHILATSHNITERKKIENDLRASQERYKSFIQQSSDGILIVDLESKAIQETNNKFLELFDVTEEEVKDMTLYSLVPLSTEEINSFVDNLTSGHLTHNQLCTHHRRKDGTLINIEISASLIYYGNTQILVAYVRDTTEKVKSDEKLKQSFRHLRNTLRETVKALTLTAEKRDPYTVGHQQRVTQLAISIAREMECSDNIIQGIETAGVLHDIGKVGVPIEILNKPGKLNDLEMALIKNHPQIGFEILQNIPFEFPVAQTVLQHHERYNGSGYPLGIKGEDILIEARIMAVADVVEAMASHRPYRPSVGVEHALDEIRHNRGILYDPQVVDSCLKLFEQQQFSFDY